MRRHLARAVALAVLALVAGPAAAAPAGTAPHAPADSAATHAREGIVSQRDLTRLLFASAAVAIVSHRDPDLTRDALKAHSKFAHDLARVGEHLGNPAYSAPALAALWAYGRLSDHRGLSASALRIAGGVLVSSVAAGGIKEVVGRWRPSESPNDPTKFTAFSSHTSFPSGHAMVAFALASGIDHETRARWVPFVVYPLATVTAWSRVHDADHWTSDVVAGAIVGLWATEKFRLVVRERESPARGARIGLLLGPNSVGVPVGAGISVRY